MPIVLHFYKVKKAYFIGFPDIFDKFFLKFSIKKEKYFTQYHAVYIEKKSKTFSLKKRISFLYT